MKKNILFLGTILLVLSARAQYCTPNVVDYGANTPGITFFNCGTFMHSSPTLEHYINTGLSFNLVKGQSYLINISFTNDIPTCPMMSVRVWIDYNQNEVLDDVTETILQFSEQTQTAVQSNFTVPQAALSGTTRMRVALKMSAECGYLPMEPCNNPPDPIGWHGEVEDYDVNIDVVGVEDVASSITNLTVYPNPADEILNGSFIINRPSNVSLFVSDLLGKNNWNLIADQLQSAGEFNFNLSLSDMNLPDGIYLLHLRSNEGTIVKPFIVVRQ